MNEPINESNEGFDTMTQEQELQMLASGPAGAGESILKFFRCDHLPDRLQAISRPFGELALHIMKCQRSAERTVALRKLLESKDAAVRAAL